MSHFYDSTLLPAQTEKRLCLDLRCEGNTADPLGQVMLNVFRKPDLAQRRCKYLIHMQLFVSFRQQVLPP